VPERNLEMTARIESAPVRYPFSFVVAGDSGAWPDPTAEAIYSQLLRQTAELEPVFFANLGDFAGPGRLRLRAHPLHRARRRAGRVGELAVEEPGGVAGPRDEALAFLAERLEATEEPHKLVLMHCPPAFDGHFEPHSEWGFNLGEPEFLELGARRGARLLRARAPVRPPRPRRDALGDLGRRRKRAVLALPRCLRRGRRAARGSRPALPRVEITVGEAGEISGRVHQAFGGRRITF
jgi:hypothetical protein